MKAFRFTAWGTPPAVIEVPDPLPGPRAVLVRVTAAGLCHSDLHVLDARPGDLPFQPPFTLGHEGSGRVEALGEGAEGVRLGDAVAIYGPWGCGACDRCAAGRDNYCRGRVGTMGMGLGQDGAMAEFVVVPSARHLVPLGEVDPVEAAPLTDAALTPYHAIAACRHRLTRESTAVVIGVGGLGHVAVQLLREMTACRVVAVDNRAAALALADRLGAHLATAANPEAPRVIRAATNGQGADLVLDFVGSAETLELAVSVLATDSDLVVIGSGGGHLPLAKSRLPQGTRVSMPFWGTLPELAEVVGLARQGLLHVEVERFGLSEAPQAVAALRSGRLAGRAVLIPDF